MLYKCCVCWVVHSVRELVLSRHRNNVGLVFGQRRRRWANIKPTLFRSIVSAESLMMDALPRNKERRTSTIFFIQSLSLFLNLCTIL